MATGQLWLLKPPRPLVEQMGEAFFRTLPAQPGVYLMCGKKRSARRRRGRWS